MDRRKLISAVLVLLLVAESRSQFFDFFGFPQIGADTNLFGNEHTTKRTKPNTIKHISNSHTRINAKNTSVSYEDSDRDTYISSAREKKRKQTTSSLTLAPIFNFFTTTTRPHRKKNKVTNASHKNISNSSENRRKNNPNQRLSYDVDVSQVNQLNNWFDRPQNAISEPQIYHEVTTKPNEKLSYNNNNYYNEYTTKNPFFNRPGVKPAVVNNGPPITNRPVTKRPRPDDNTTVRPDTNKPVTVRPYVVNPIPTDAGAVVFPNEDDQPEIIRGMDEDFISEAEKRRYIEISEKMCDQYKSLNTKQLAAIPLLPSPEPVQFNVSKCAPSQVPLVVGGKVVSIREFPHTALLGWLKIDSGGYSWKCGGSLVSDQWILTAAHCSYQERDNTVVTGPPRVVQLGSTYLDDPGALVVRVSAVVRHPKYKFPRSYYDLALLKLVQPVSFSEVIKPACLGVPPPVNSPVIAVGWGKTEFGGDQSLELRAVSLPVWDMPRCHEVLGTSRKMPEGPSSGSQMCAGDEKGGKDTCQGDSGGPVQIQDGCAWRVVAVTSLGRSCGAPNTPGLYALVQRPFVAATIFADYKNNNAISDSSQNNSGQNNYSSGTSKNNNKRTTTTTEVYYDNDYNNQNRRSSETYNNQNRRTTTTTELYYNNINKRTTTSTEAPYNDYNNQNRRPSEKNNNNNNNQNRGTTTTTELYYNNINKRTTTSTEAYYNNDYNNQNRRSSETYNNNQNRRTTTTTELYYNNINNQNYGQNNRRTSTVQPYYNQNRNRRTTTTTESYYNDYNQNNQPNSGSNKNRRNPYANNQDYYDNNYKQNRHSTPKNNNYDLDFYNHNNRQNNNQDYWNNQPQNNNYGRTVDRYEEGRIWWTRK